MTRWSVEQVEGTAPDSAVLSAGHKLATPGPWSQAGCSDSLLWGQCQGSGKTPYQVSVDVMRPAYRCSCPSLKFPCKHALGLMLLWANSDPIVDPMAQVPDTVADWQAKAASTQAARAARTHSPAIQETTSPTPEASADPTPEETAKPVKPPTAKPIKQSAQAQRLASRLATMDAGMADFALWLHDLVRTGFADARSQPRKWWDGTAARLVDAQLPGLADQVRQVGREVNAREDWPDMLLETVGRWWLTAQAWHRRDTLDPNTYADLKVVLGWAIPSEDVQAETPLPDSWLVLGSHRTFEGRIQAQRTWIRGSATGELGVVINYAGGSASLPTALEVGTSVTGTVAPYPGHPPRRMVLPEIDSSTPPIHLLPQGDSLSTAHRERAIALELNPWLIRQPAIVEDLRFGLSSVRDSQGSQVEYTRNFSPSLALALTGGAPVRCFGELEESRFRPLTVQLHDRLAAV